jgi:hypothetical protein
MTSRTTSFALILLICVLGCENNKTGVIDSKGTPPFLSNETLSPDSTNIDAQVPLNGRYSITMNVSARVVDPDGPSNVAAVIATVILPRSSDVILRVPLHDDGISPDPVAGDGVYTGQIQYQITRPQSGRQRVQVNTQDFEGLQGNILERSFYAARNNSPPTLANITAPDTLTIPVGGTVILHMTVTAADSDGLGDITEVYFRSPDGLNPTFKFPLKDDGAVGSGDQTAGDGIFSIILPVSDSPTVRGTYRFLFQAADTFGDTSATLIQRITLR